MKHVKAFLTASVIATSFAFSPLASTQAEAKQCIWNKAGFVLHVDWFPTGNVYADETGKIYTKPGVRPTQTDIFPVAQGRCIEKPGKYVAVLKIEGREWVKKGLAIGITTSTAIGSGLLGAVACAGTAGAACPAAAAGVAAAVGGISTAAGEFIPEPADIGLGAFGTTVPPSNRWMDVWGSAFDPQVGLGGHF